MKVICIIHFFSLSVSSPLLLSISRPLLPFMVKIKWSLSALTFTYSNHLNTGLVWYSNGRFVSGCQMVRYSNGGLKTGLKKACLWSKMSGIQMVRQVTWLYHLNTGHPYCLVFRWIRYSDVRYSDGYCTQITSQIGFSGDRIPAI